MLLHSAILCPSPIKGCHFENSRSVTSPYCKWALKPCREVCPVAEKFASLKRSLPRSSDAKIQSYLFHVYS